jgi:radical SAM protein (TIGR01212 family)
VQEFSDAVKAAHRHDIKVCAHIILGLPGETREDMLGTIRFLAEHKVWGVKLHNLHILKDTPLEKMYNEGKVKTLSLEEYASLVVDCLEHLPKDIVIHRFNGHSPRSLTVAPAWSVNKLATLNAVHNELLRRNTFQGKIM